MGKRYKSVSELVRKSSGDPAFVKAFEKEVAKRKLAKTLFAMRCARGLSQKEMASKLGCTQSRISKLEHSATDSIRVGDLMAYAQALSLNLGITFRERMTAVELVKYHAFEIKRHLDHLGELASGDAAMSEGVEEFHKECMHNIARIIRDSMSRLKKMRPKRKPILEVNAPEDSPIDTEFPVPSD